MLKVLMIKSNRGAAVAEYGILAALVAVVSIFSVWQFGGTATSTFEQTSSAMASGQVAADEGEPVLDTSAPFVYTAGNAARFSSETACYIGTPGDEYITSANGYEFKDMQCVDGMGGKDQLTDRNTNTVARLVYMRPGGAIMSFSTAPHWVTAEHFRTATDSFFITGLTTGSVVDFRWWDLDQITVAKSASNMTLTTPLGGSLILRGIVGRSGFPQGMTFVFRDVTLDSDGIYAQSSIRHGTDDRDTMIGDSTNQTFYPKGGSDLILPMGGNDIIHQESGDLTVEANYNDGNDTLFLSDWSFASTTVTAGTYQSVVLTLSDDTRITVKRSNGEAAGETVSYIENFVFSDGTKSAAQVIAAIGN